MPLTGSFFNPYNQYSGKNKHNYDCEFSMLQGYYFGFIEYCTPVPLRRTYSEKSSFSRSRLHRRASVARRTYCVSQINVFDLYSSALEDFRFQTSMSRMTRFLREPACTRVLWTNFLIKSGA